MFMGLRRANLEIIGKCEKTGTKITFKADPDIFIETTVYVYETVKSRLRELSYLNKESSYISERRKKRRRG